VAAPVGHIICALALLNNSAIKMSDPENFFIGTSFPDIRYVANLDRKTTHKLKENNLSYVLKAPTSFEGGRRFHVLVDKKREEHMRNNNAYRFVENNNFKSHMLKMVEDKILFDRLKNTNFNAQKIFTNINEEERSYGLDDRVLKGWHKVLAGYLDTHTWFSLTRYYQAFAAYKQAFGAPKRLFQDLWTSLKTLGFLCYAYAQIEILSRNKEVQAIVLDFYDKKIPELINLSLSK
jgi:hypothetical protein